MNKKLDRDDFESCMGHGLQLLRYNPTFQKKEEEEGEFYKRLMEAIDATLAEHDVTLCTETIAVITLMLAQLVAQFSDNNKLDRHKFLRTFFREFEELSDHIHKQEKKNEKKD